MSVLLSTAYFPPALWMALAVQGDGVVLERSEHFMKQSYRSRCHISGPMGTQVLSVPVDRKEKDISKITISYAENWVKDHLRAIESNYSNAPFFEVLFPDVEDVLHQQYPTLWELNSALINMFFRWLDMDFSPGLTREYVVEFEGFDARGLHPKKTFLEVDYPPYGQVFSGRNGFEKGLSAIDVFFNLGRSSWDYFQELEVPGFRS